MPLSPRLVLPLWLLAWLGGAFSFLARCDGGVPGIVNTDVITFSELRDLTAAKVKAAKETLRGDELFAKVKEIQLAGMNELVDRLLVLQEFKSTHKKGSGITPEVLDSRIDAIVHEQFGDDRSAFTKSLLAQGLTLERFRQREEENIIVETMRKEHQPTNDWLAKLRQKAFIKIQLYSENGAEILD